MKAGTQATTRTPLKQRTIGDVRRLTANMTTIPPFKRKKILGAYGVVNKGNLFESLYSGRSY